MDIESIYRSYSQDVMNVAYFYTGNQEDAEDVMVDVFLSIMARPPKNEANLKSYLFRSAMNKSFDLRKRRRPDPLETEIAAPVDQTPQQAFLVSAIAKLPLKYREVLVLRFVEEMPEAEIASFLRLSLSAVKKRVQRGKEKLKKELERHG